MAGHTHRGAADACAFPGRQHVSSFMAVQDGVSQLQSSGAHPPSWRLGTAVQPPSLGIAHSRCREYDSRRGFPTLGIPCARPRFHQPNDRVDPRPAIEHFRPRESLARHIREHSVADNSYKAYRRAFEYWKQWTRLRGIPWQMAVPLDEQVHLISEFIIDCSRKGLGSGRPVRGSTIKTSLCGILHFFTAAGLAFPVSHPQVRMLLKGVGRLNVPHHRRAPVTVAILEKCVSVLDLHDPADQALWGVLCLAFFFMLRRSEIVATTGTAFQWFALKASDISATDASGFPTTDPRAAQAVCIRLRGSKTNQGDIATTCMLEQSGHPVLCPVLGALLLLHARRQLPMTTPAAMFMDKNSSPSCVTAKRVAVAIQHAAYCVGEDPSQFGTHSLRSGGATNIYRAGVDALTIQFHGRWVSDAYKRYTRLCRESVSSVASRMVSGSGESTLIQ